MLNVHCTFDQNLLVVVRGECLLKLFFQAQNGFYHKSHSAQVGELLQ